MDRKLLHDLKGPLHAIRGYASLLADAPELSDRHRGFAAAIDSSAQLLDHILENSRILSVPAGSPLPGGDRPGALDALARSACSGLERAFAAKNCRLVAACPPRLLGRAGDWVERLAVNLLISALQTATSGTEVRLEAAEEQGGLVLRVAAPGVSPVDLGGSLDATARLLDALGGISLPAENAVAVSLPIERLG